MRLIWDIVHTITINENTWKQEKKRLVVATDRNWKLVLIDNLKRIY